MSKYNDELLALREKLKTSMSLESVYCAVCYTFICHCLDSDLNGSYFICQACRPETIMQERNI